MEEREREREREEREREREREKRSIRGRTEGLRHRRRRRWERGNCSACVSGKCTAVAAVARTQVVASKGKPEKSVDLLAPARIVVIRMCSEYEYYNLLSVSPLSLLLPLYLSHIRRSSISGGFGHVL